MPGVVVPSYVTGSHDDVIKWKHFTRYWPFVWGIHRSPGNSPHKGQWRRALMFCFICAWISGWVNNREAGDLRRHCAHYDVIVMFIAIPKKLGFCCITTMQCMVCANKRVHYGPVVVFVCLHIRLSDKSWPCRVAWMQWTYKIPGTFYQASVCLRMIVYAIYGAVWYQLAHSSFGDC